MGFLFNLLIVFLALPLLGFLLLARIKTNKRIFGSLFKIILATIIGLVILGYGLKRLRSKKEMTRSDIYGEYIIDRTKFPGHQADWQYNHFRFRIKKNDSIYFHETEGEKIIRTTKGKIRFKEYYKSPRIEIVMENQTHHILSEIPTLYRTTWDFYYVFKSPRFFNVFFKQGKWEPIEK